MRDDDNPREETVDPADTAAPVAGHALGDLDELDHEAAIEPEDGVAASLQSALVALREQADGVAGTPASKADAKVTAAEGVAEAAAALDEQIGAIARRDEE